VIPFSGTDCTAIRKLTDATGAVDAGQRDANGGTSSDACKPDRDGDGVPNGTDNRPDAPNPGQQDTDHDGVGNARNPTP
jgi:hypothetical protein